MLKTVRGGNFSPSKKFDDITYQRDFESGQLAAIRGKHSNDCTFRLPDRKAAWQCGFRDATYENVSNTQVAAPEMALGHILAIREKFLTK